MHWVDRAYFAPSRFKRLAALPTIRKLSDQGAKVILASHLGRPGGERKPELSLSPVAPVLAGKLQRPVLFLEDCVGDEVQVALEELNEGDVALLENLRFNPGERANDPDFANQLANLADAYVNDAFGTAHRAHASTYGVAERLPIKVSGYVIARELKYLGEKTAQPGRPFVVILGGAKVSDKIQVIDALLEKADTLIVGGAMAYTFALAQGGRVGDSLVEPDKVDLARQLLADGADTLVLPLDTHCGDDFKAPSQTCVVPAGEIPDGFEGLDIGPRTAERFAEIVKSSRTIVWNGPMGVSIAVCNAVTDITIHPWLTPSIFRRWTPCPAASLRSWSPAIRPLPTRWPPRPGVWP